MTERIDNEIALLRSIHPKLEVTERDSMVWILIPDYRIVSDLWDRKTMDVSFAVSPSSYPGTSPYGFHVRGGINLQDGRAAQNYQPSSQNPFSGNWGIFSWQGESWQPATEISAGSNLVNFVQSFNYRLNEGY